MLSDHQMFPLWIAGFIAIFALAFFYFPGRKAAGWLLLLCGLTMAFFIANLSSFFWIWDEQYHALVAKHLADNPLKPVLYEHPVLDYFPHQWTGNYIWLHKQPLFLWQMAVSIKLFGNSVLAARLPSMCMFTLTALFTYDIGKNLRNRETGFIAALLFCTNHYLLELVAGRYSTDHNDIAFLFYMTAGFWSWLKYQQTGYKRWLILTGAFSGCAILVKWLVGLLIYAVWMSRIGAENSKDWFRLRNYFPLLTALSITLVVALPWQLYILNAFPHEALYELGLNSKHFTEVVENHGGDCWFHFRAVSDLYGKGILVPYTMLMSFAVFVFTVPKLYRLPLIVAVLLPYLFYSLAQTKMTSFTVISMPFGLLALANLIQLILSYLGKLVRKAWIGHSLSCLAVLGICFLSLDLQKISELHGDRNKPDVYLRKSYYRQVAAADSVNKLLHGKNWVVFNADLRVNGHIEMMYFTDKIAYGFIPASGDLEKVEAAGYRAAIIDNGHLPHYILNDSHIRKITVEEE